MKIDPGSWCRGKDCRHHPTKVTFVWLSALRHCIFCTRKVAKDLYAPVQPSPASEEKKA